MQTKFFYFICLAGQRTKINGEGADFRCHQRTGRLAQLKVVERVSLLKIVERVPQLKVIERVPRLQVNIVVVLIFQVASSPVRLDDDGGVVRRRQVAQVAAAAAIGQVFEPVGGGVEFLQPTHGSSKGLPTASGEGMVANRSVIMLIR
jgi:hypothetical protein